MYHGCMDTTGLNFNPTATVPATCIDKLTGCMTHGAANYRKEANFPAVCYFIGCTDSTRANFDPLAGASFLFWEGSTSRFL
jgi:hypothetical protein